MNETENTNKKKEKVWSIADLNCFQIHSFKNEIENGKLVYGTAIAPDGYRHSNTWIEKDEKVIDLFNWEKHIKEGIAGKIDKIELRNIKKHLKSCDIDIK